MALNAFNLNSNDTNVKRDLGIVMLGSVVPVRTGARLTFPLYLGGGYLLSKVSRFCLVRARYRGYVVSGGRELVARSGALG
ncbi:MAG: hypothetical protein WKG07_32160 [Hymenobacter sp.]